MRETTWETNRGYGNNMNINLKVGCEVIDRMQLAQDKFQWLCVVKMIMHLLVP
jgi:hypothetical protein